MKMTWVQMMLLMWCCWCEGRVFLRRGMQVWIKIIRWQDIHNLYKNTRTHYIFFSFNVPCIVQVTARHALYYTFFILFWKFYYLVIIQNITIVKVGSNKWFIYPKAFRGRFTESLLISPITLLHFLIASSTWELKFDFESNIITKCFWLEHLAMLLLLNLAGGWKTFN